MYFGSTLKLPSTAGGVLGAVVRIQHSGIGDLRGLGIRGELEHQVALLGHGHRDRVPRPRRDVERRAVTVDGPADLGVRVAVLPDDGELRVVARRGLGQPQRHVGDVADVGHRPDLRLAGLDLQLGLELAVHGVLQIALILRQRRVLGDLLAWAVEGDQVGRHEVGLAAVVLRRQRAGPPRCDVLGAHGGIGDVDRGQARLIRAVGQLVALGRLGRAHPLTPAVVVQLMALPVSVEHVVVLNRHVAHRNVVLRDEWQVAVGSTDLEQPRQAEIGLLGRHRVAVAVVPVQPVGHVLRHVVGVGVAHPGGDRQHHVVGVAGRTDVQTVGVQVERRLGERRRVDGHLTALGSHRRIVEVLDRQALKIVVVVHDQLLARVHPQCRRGIHVVALGRAVRSWCP